MLSGLSLSVTPSTISENNGSAEVTVSRTSTVGDLQIQLSSSDETEALVPQTVTIPAGSTSVTFSVDAVDDVLLDGVQTVQISAVATGALQIDTSYGVSGFGSVPGPLSRDAAVLPNGQVIVTFSSGADFGVSRLNVDGTVDLTFGVNGVAIVDVSGESDVPEAVVVQSDGKIVIAGTGYNGPQFDFVMARLNSNGTLDSTFGSGGKVLVDMGPGSYNEIWDLALQGDGKILAGGNLSNNGTNLTVTRYNSDGSIDTSFGVMGTAEINTSRGSDRGHGIVVQSDGRIVLTGGTFGGNDSSTVTLVRLTTTGSIDTGFGVGGIVQTNLPGWYEQGSEIALQPDGRLLVIGRVSDPNVFPPQYHPVVLRYQVNGSLDTTFGATAPGYTIVQHQSDNFSLLGIGLLSDGRVLSSGSNGGTPMLNVFSPSGGLLQTISLSGSQAVQVAVSDSDDVFVVAGNSLSRSGVSKLTTAELSGSASLSVTDYEVIDLAMAEFADEGGQLTATVSRSNSDNFGPITVQISYSHSSELAGPEFVVIPAGQSSVSFSVNVQQDFDLDGDVITNITTTSDGYVSGFAQTTVSDSGRIRIDILPNDDSNRIEARTKEIAAGIYSAANFDATRIDVSTIRLSDGSTEVPVAVQRKRGYRTAMDDLNNDGRLDLIVWFDITGLNRSTGARTLTLSGVFGEISFWGNDEVEFFKQRGGR
ncbi:MAG: hypothetical protein JNL58_16260 [Planctomyces sp.]|nr:hypothetical protein [Planctomyces sp.]